MFVMGSVRCPAPLPVDLCTLETKVNDLHRKLDLLLSQNTGGCPMCLTCAQHKRQQEATASQLSSQAKLLESLERKVLNIQTALETVLQDLEEKHSTDKVSIPLTVLQRRKSLPVRTSVDEVYVHLDKTRNLNVTQHGHNVAYRKGILEEVKESVVKMDSEQQRRKDSAKELIIGHLEDKLHSQSEKEATAGKQNVATSQPIIENQSLSSSKATCLTVPVISTIQSLATLPDSAKASVTMVKETAGSLPCHKSPKTTALSASLNTVPSKLGTSLPNIAVTREIEPEDTKTSASNQKPSKLKGLAVPTAAETEWCAAATQNNNIKANVTLAPSHKPPKTTGLSAPVIKMTQALATSLEAKGTMTVNATPLTDTAVPQARGSQAYTASSPDIPSIKQDTSTYLPSHKPSKMRGLAVPHTTMAQGSASPSPNSPGEKLTGNEAAKASLPGLSSPKVTGLAVPGTTAEGSLRHVSSCPESLQKFQGSGKPADSCPPPCPPVKNQAERAGAVSANKLTAAGIQIKISPVPDKNTLAAKPQSPPKTCIKVIDDVPPQPAPFPHRFVSLRPNSLGDTYNIHTTEVLGGGRFGKVHRCTESKTGLRLAAKIISTRNVKEKEMVLNEIQVMNQLSHINILQLYDAFEVKNQVVLILEYVEGGELFERIVDESWSLTEVDAMVFVRQICEGIHYMHQMYVLHLDLKPENILCVSRTGHQVKIIDFGLARRYKPREKLRVSFGTPEFLAPEVVNFDFVSFPTDMWTLGVVTYMLVSGLSPFLGDDDSQTLNNVLMVNWYFDEDAFEHVSAEAKDFISNLLIRERSGRLSAAQCLKHPWLNNISEKAKKSNIVLKSQVLLKKYMARKMWKKNYIAIAAANRFKRLGSSGSLTSLAV